MRNLIDTLKVLGEGRKAAPDGTKRTWGGKPMIKKNGEWVYDAQFDRNGRPTSGGGGGSPSNKPTSVNPTSSTKSPNPEPEGDESTSSYMKDYRRKKEAQLVRNSEGSGKYSTWQSAVNDPEGFAATHAKRATKLKDETAKLASEVDKLVKTPKGTPDQEKELEARARKAVLTAGANVQKAMFSAGSLVNLSEHPATRSSQDGMHFGPIGSARVHVDNETRWTESHAEKAKESYLSRFPSTQDFRGAWNDARYD